MGGSEGFYGVLEGLRGVLRGCRRVLKGSGGVLKAFEVSKSSRGGSERFGALFGKSRR